MGFIEKVLGLLVYIMSHVADLLHMLFNPMVSFCILVGEELINFLKEIGDFMARLFGKHQHTERGSLWVSGRNSTCIKLNFTPHDAGAEIDYNIPWPKPCCGPVNKLHDKVAVNIHRHELRLDWDVTGTVLLKWYASK